MKRTWGDTVGTIGLVFAIIGFVFGIFALIPLFGIVFFWIALIPGIIGLAGGIAGATSAASKKKCITAIVFASLAIVFAFSHFIFLAALAA